MGQRTGFAATVAVLACVLALAGTCVWVPMVCTYTLQPDGYVPYPEPISEAEWRVAWDAGVYKIQDGTPGVDRSWAEYSWEPVWLMIVGEHLLVLLVAGGIAAWNLRRARSRLAVG